MSGLKKRQLQNLTVLVVTVLIQIIIWKIRGNRGYVGVDSRRYIGLANTLLENSNRCRYCSLHCANCHFFLEKKFVF